MWKILVALCLASTAEAWVCRCGLFAESQIDNQDNVRDASSPLVYEDIELTDPVADLCGGDADTASSVCEVACHDWFDEQYGDDFGYCTRAPDGSSRCYGGTFCYVLQTENHVNVTDENVNMFDRIPECDTVWEFSTRQLIVPLCCENGDWISCAGADDFDCECYSGDADLCDCGVFSEDQFDQTPPTENDPLPFAFLGLEVSVNGTDGYCEGFTSESDPCRQLCEDAGNAEFASYSFNDINEDSAGGLTYGTIYCGALEARGYNLMDDFFTYLTVYQRAPTCADEDWYEVVGVEHPDPLCCDRDGNHRPNCEPVSPGPP